MIQWIFFEKCLCIDGHFQITVAPRIDWYFDYRVLSTFPMIFDRFGDLSRPYLNFKSRTQVEADTIK